MVLHAQNVKFICILYWIYICINIINKTFFQSFKKSFSGGLGSRQSPQNGGRLPRPSGLPSLPLVRWRHRIGLHFPAHGKTVRGLRQEEQASVHRLSCTPGWFSSSYQRAGLSSSSRLVNSHVFSILAGNLEEKDSSFDIKFFSYWL